MMRKGIFGERGSGVYRCGDGDNMEQITFKNYLLIFHLMISPNFFTFSQFFKSTSCILNLGVKEHVANL